MATADVKPSEDTGGRIGAEDSRLLDSRELESLRVALLRCADQTRAESYRSEAIRDACGMIAVETDALREKLATGERDDTVGAQQAVEQFIRGCAGARTIALEQVDKALAQLGPAPAPTALTDEAVAERSDHYRAFLRTWQYEDWLAEYERALDSNNETSRRALDSVFDELAASAEKQARRQKRYAAAGLAAPPEPAGPAAMRGFRAALAQLRDRQLLSGPGLQRRRLQRERDRFVRFMKQRLGV